MSIEKRASTAPQKYFITLLFKSTFLPPDILQRTVQSKINKSRFMKIFTIEAIVKIC